MSEEPFMNDYEYGMVRGVSEYISRLYASGDTKKAFILLGSMVNSILILMAPEGRRYFLDMIGHIQEEAEGEMFEDVQDYINFCKDEGEHGL